ncbi:hypothetical protein C8R43DRAFT_1116181 [Mycena crocata]|nr:hypothetical protein C8R43DRAFT_1116181 [Mycena crocata]
MPPPADSSLLYSPAPDIKPDMNLVSDSCSAELPDLNRLIPHYITLYAHLQAMDHQCLLDLAIIQQDKLALHSDILRRASSGAVDGRVVPELIFAAAHKVHYCMTELLFTLKSLCLSAARAHDGDGQSVEFPLVNEFLPMFEYALTDLMDDLEDWTRIQS